MSYKPISPEKFKERNRKYDRQLAILRDRLSEENQIFDDECVPHVIETDPDDDCCSWQGTYREMRCPLPMD